MAVSSPRCAHENNEYRLVEREDIVAGAEILMIERERALADPAYPPSKIRLDDDPIADRDGVPYVYYHCTYPEWDGQCFVPLDDFLGYVDDDPHHVNYWLPFSS